MNSSENIYSRSCSNMLETQVKKLSPAFGGVAEMCATSLDRQRLQDVSSELSPQVDESVSW